MIRVAVNQAFKDLVALPSVAVDEVVTLTITKASGGTLSGGTFTYVSGSLWKITFTPATLNEVYAAVVTDAAGDIIFRESYEAIGTVYDGSTGPTGTIVVGTNSWVTAQEAEDYFATRIGVGTRWSELTDAEKIAALITSYRFLISCSLYSIESDEDASNVKYAQIEMALFLVIHAADMDARQGIQAQGVSQAGIVQETYDLSRAGEVAIPPIVKSLLYDYQSGSPIKAIDLTRDEDEDVV